MRNYSPAIFCCSLLYCCLGNTASFSPDYTWYSPPA